MGQALQIKQIVKGSTNFNKGTKSKLEMSTVKFDMPNLLKVIVNQQKITSYKDFRRCC